MASNKLQRVEKESVNGENTNEEEELSSSDEESNGVTGNPKPEPLTDKEKLKNALEMGPQLDFKPGSIEDGFYNKFMNPMLAQLESRISENNAILDRISKDMQDDREKRRKDMLSKHIPGPLKADGQSLKDVMRHLEHLIVYESYEHVADDDFEEDHQVKAKLRDLDENSEVAILCHSIAAYISLLDPQHLKYITDKMVGDTTLWLSRLFRCKDSEAYFHDVEGEGLVKICKLVINEKYPKFSEDGYEAIYTKPPVIYMSEAATEELTDTICKGLGLPKSCVSLVPFMDGNGAKQRINCKTLEKLIDEDLVSGKTPLMMIGFAGTPIVGHVDNLARMRVLCKKHNMWLHVEGNHLATLSMFSVPTDVQPASAGDSMTLRLSLWLGLPAIPYVTLYKTSSKQLADQVGLTHVNTQYKLSCLPLWVCLQNMGHQGVVDKMKSCLDLAKEMYKKIENVITIKSISKLKPAKQEEIRSLGDLISRTYSALTIFEISSPSVVFRFIGSANQSTGDSDEAKAEAKPTPQFAPYAAVSTPETDPSPDETASENKEEEEAEDDGMFVPNTDYLDSLNIWLVETMKRECPKVHLEAVHIDKEGVCIRFAPFETAQVYGSTLEDIESWGSAFDRQIVILNATMVHRESFQELVDAQDNLKLVNLSGWAGLGAIQYVPDQWIDQYDDLSTQGQDEVTELNSELVKRLKANDTAFSAGRDSKSITCVRFGLITEDTDMFELVGLVYTTGKEVEESLKYMEKMAEAVQQGIEAATKDLEKENEERIMQEGILRSVPLVGSVVNWFSPVQKDGGLKGRTFNLNSGRVASTEETYKYHMQIQEPSSKPEAKDRKGPLKSHLKPPKKRSSSVGSNTSAGTSSLHNEEQQNGNDSGHSSGRSDTADPSSVKLTNSNKTDSIPQETAAV